MLLVLVLLVVLALVLVLVLALVLLWYRHVPRKRSVSRVFVSVGCRDLCRISQRSVP